MIKLTDTINLAPSLNEIHYLGKNGKQQTVKIEHQLMQILLLLMDHREQLVAKELFIDSIWDGNQFIGEKALTKNIYKLRILFKEMGIDSQLQVHTIPKKGYRLLINDSSQKKKIVSNRLLTTILFLTIICTALYFLLKPERKQIPLYYFNSNGQPDSVIQLDRNNVTIISDSNSQFITLDSLKNKH